MFVLQIVFPKSNFALVFNFRYWTDFHPLFEHPKWILTKFPSINSFFWKSTKIKIMSHNSIKTNSIQTTDFLTTFWSEMATITAYANSTVVFLFSPHKQIKMEMKNTSLPLHQMIFSWKHPHRLLRIAEGKGFMD